MDEATAIETKPTPAPAAAQDATKTVETSDLARRFREQKAARSAVEMVWDQIERFFAPLGTGSRPYSNISEGSVEWNRWDVWDSSAIDASEKLTAHIHGSVTSPAIRWFKLAWRDEDLQADKESAAWLDAVSEAIFRTLTDSDFNTEIASADGDLVRFGNCFVIEEAADELEWKGVDFEAIPIRECYFEQDSRGGVETFFRRLSWTPIQMADLCRRKRWPIPEDIEAKARNPSEANTPIEFVFCIFKRYDVAAHLDGVARRNRERAKRRVEAAKVQQAGKQPPAVEQDEPTYPLAATLRPFGCVYFKGENGDRIGVEGGYYEMPSVFARWAKTAGSQWGHGPCNILLPTAKELNALVETEHMALAKAVDPPVEVEERGLIGGRLDFEPAGVNPVRKTGTIKPIESHARFDIADSKANDLRSQLYRGLHNDELTLKDSPAMTAMEVQARYELMNRVLGSTLARIENDELSPIVKITLGHLARANQLPPMPAKVKERYGDRPQFDVEYQGPLARSQRTDEVAAIERVLAAGAAVLKMGYPLKLVVAIIDIPKAIREIATRLGTPADLLKNPAEVEKLLKEMDDADRRMAAAAMSKAEGEAAGAHAGAAAQMAMAQGAGAGGGGGRAALPPGPVPAQPAPVVSPAYGPAAPFAQPAPAT